MEHYPGPRISGEPAVLDELARRLATPGGTWERAPNRDISGGRDGCAFRRSGTEDCLTLFVVRRPLSEGLETFKITNIVPRGPERISLEDYNDLLESFLAHVEAVGAGLDLSLRREPTSVTIESYLAPELVELLDAFSNCANKSIPHPLDDERWRRFVIAAHRRSANIPLDVLRDGLVSRGWDADGADRLTSQCEFARELLRDYDADSEAKSREQ
ncbi:MAG: hypothetical protein AB7O84_09475 [Planctomycetota bacterium]